MYGNNNYQDQGYHPSYKQDDDRSYVNYDKYKSKDKETSNSVSISKIKCENVNNNFNNVVIENLNIGNSGSRGGVATSEDDGSNGVVSANAYGNNNGDKYNDGYDKKGKDITCIINNNNTVITGGNATDGNGNIIGTCEECFREFLTPVQLSNFLEGSSFSLVHIVMQSLLQATPLMNHNSLVIYNC